MPWGNLADKSSLSPFILSDFGLIIAGTTLIITLSSFYPAKKAAQTDPLTVLRNE